MHASTYPRARCMRAALACARAAHERLRKLPQHACSSQLQAPCNFLQKMLRVDLALPVITYISMTLSYLP